MSEDRDILFTAAKIVSLKLVSAEHQNEAGVEVDLFNVIWLASEI